MVGWIPTIYSDVKLVKLSSFAVYTRYIPVIAIAVKINDGKREQLNVTLSSSIAAKRKELLVENNCSRGIKRFTVCRCSTSCLCEDLTAYLESATINWKSLSPTRIVVVKIISHVGVFCGKRAIVNAIY